MLKDGLKEFWYIIRIVESILYILLKVVSKLVIVKFRCFKYVSI